MVGPPFLLLLRKGIPLRFRCWWIEGHRLTFRTR